MGSPVSVRQAKPDNLIQLWLGTYATVRLDAENIRPPAGRLRCRPERGGLTRVNDNSYLTGPPELMVEVAASSTSIALRDQRRACCRTTAGLRCRLTRKFHRLRTERRLAIVLAVSAHPKPVTNRRSSRSSNQAACEISGLSPGGIDAERSANWKAV
jgi:hypothetical protein